MSDYLYLPDLDKELDDLRDLFEDGTLADDEAERLKELRDLQEELGGDFNGDEQTLIPDDEFEDFCREMAYDVGYVEEDSALEGYIDWEKWAQDCQMDYINVDFDGREYWILSI